MAMTENIDVKFQTTTLNDVVDFLKHGIDSAVVESVNITPLRMRGFWADIKDGEGRLMNREWVAGEPRDEIVIKLSGHIRLPPKTS